MSKVKGWSSSLNVGSLALLAEFWPKVSRLQYDISILKHPRHDICTYDRNVDLPTASPRSKIGIDISLIVEDVALTRKLLHAINNNASYVLTAIANARECLIK